MAAKNRNAAQDRLPNIKSVSRRICAICDEANRCQELRHQQMFVERWMCMICSQEYISRAGSILHMKKEHKGKPTVNTDSYSKTCECGQEFLTVYQYNRHRSTVLHVDGIRTLKRARQTNDDQELNSER